MAIRKVIKIDEELCDGCGLCVPACAEGAIRISDGKARLIHEVFCDGLGACLGECPRGAISIEEREAADFDKSAAQYHSLKESGDPCGDRPRLYVIEKPSEQLACGCPGSAMQTFAAADNKGLVAQSGRTEDHLRSRSALTHWPVQLSLVPSAAPFLKNADVLVCADCVPFTVPDFHRRFLEGRVVLVGCPKLDDLAAYGKKLTEIFSSARPRSITVLRMEVPCCGGITGAVLDARNRAAPWLPVQVHTMNIRGGETPHVVPALLVTDGGGER